ncbi:hypothetical protein TRICI_005057 [Trichomonascus ciferrii]|uniref:Integrase catalytic domain-containing protein n=1 Tax=Trichomonascus ciferrii TaxID=44093 RepID=A0A642UWN2_9ASCO|nr:hypothetical protein TRICI_005057 [Trichomonascus ciferrii]
MFLDGVYYIHGLSGTFLSTKLFFDNPKFDLDIDGKGYQRPHVMAPDGSEKRFVHNYVTRGNLSYLKLPLSIKEKENERDFLNAITTSQYSKHQIIMDIHNKGHTCTNFYTIFENIRKSGTIWGKACDGVDGFLKGLDPKDFRCDFYERAKTTNKSYPLTHTRAENKGNIIHSDLTGDLLLSVEGYKNLSIFRDDNTGFVWARPLFQKNDVAQEFVYLKRLIETQFETKVKTLRTDNGGEYQDDEFQKYLKANGMQHQTIVPRIHEQNGTAERTIRTLCGLIRANMLQGNIPDQFWAVCSYYCATVMNCVYLHDDPSEEDTGDNNQGSVRKTAYQRLFGRKPDLSDLHVFGCDAVIFIPVEDQGSAFSPRGIDGFYLCPMTSSKGAWIFVVDHQEIVGAYHVDESSFNNVLCDDKALGTPAYRRCRVSALNKWLDAWSRKMTQG